VNGALRRRSSSKQRVAANLLILISSFLLRRNEFLAAVEPGSLFLTTSVRARSNPIWRVLFAEQPPPIRVRWLIRLGKRLGALRVLPKALRMERRTRNNAIIALRADWNMFMPGADIFCWLWALGLGGLLMASNSNSGQKFISRNRKPRVHITYEDPYDAEKLIELPFVMGVLADLSGNSSDVAKADMNDRAFLDIDMDNFDKRMAAIEPGLAMKVANKLGDESGEKLSVKLTLKKMEDFSPAAVARQIPATAKLLQAREQLSNLLRYMDGKSAAEGSLKKLLADPQLMAALKEKLADKPAGDKPAGDNSAE
jgi:type VI secretion system protein ImpB